MYNVHVQVNAEKTSEMYCVNLFTVIIRATYSTMGGLLMSAYL